MKLIFALPALGIGALFLLPAQQPAAPRIFTAAQAEAGRVAYMSSCFKCHTEAMTGRKGEPGEMPLVESLPKVMRDVVNNAGGQVPPLVGPDFMSRWSDSSTAALNKRIAEAVGGFPPEVRNDQTSINLTAYFLQANGAQPGDRALTSATSAGIGTVTAK